MPTIEDYIKEIEKDVEISELNVRDRQMMLPAIKHKYAGLLIRAKINLSTLYNKRADKKKDIGSLLQESSPYDLSDANAGKMAEKHDDVVKLSRDIRNKQLEIELFEKAEKIFSSMTFDIKNLIEIMKLEIE